MIAKTADELSGICSEDKHISIETIQVLLCTCLVFAFFIGMNTISCGSVLATELKFFCCCYC